MVLCDICTLWAGIIGWLDILVSNSSTESRLSKARRQSISPIFLLQGSDPGAIAAVAPLRGLSAV